MISDLAAAAAAPALSKALDSTQFLDDQLRSLRASIAAVPIVDYREMFRLSAHLSEMLAPLAKQLTTFQASMAWQYADALGALRTWQPELMRSVAEAMRVQFDARSTLSWLVAAELNRRDWWVVPSWDAAFLGRLLRVLGQRRGQRVLVDFLRAHYEKRRCRELRQMTETWSLPELRKRRALVREAVALYQRRRYSAALKLLTGFEEAIVKEALIRTQRIDAATARNTRAPKLLTIHVTQGRSAVIPFEAVFTDLFTEFTWGASWSGRAVKRHPIAHGGVPQNRAVLALRMFLVLDTLDHFLTRLK